MSSQSMQQLSQQHQQYLAELQADLIESFGDMPTAQLENTESIWMWARGFVRILASPFHRSIFVIIDLTLLADTDCLLLTNRPGQ